MYDTTVNKLVKNLIEAEIHPNHPNMVTLQTLCDSLDTQNYCLLDSLKEFLYQNGESAADTARLDDIFYTRVVNTSPSLTLNTAICFPALDSTLNEDIRSDWDEVTPDYVVPISAYHDTSSIVDYNLYHVDTNRVIQSQSQDTSQWKANPSWQIVLTSLTKANLVYTGQYVTNGTKAKCLCHHFDNLTNNCLERQCIGALRGRCFPGQKPCDSFATCGIVGVVISFFYTD